MLMVLWIFVGWATGWLTGRSLEGKGYGRSMDVVMGIGGGVLGGLLTGSVGLAGHPETILGTLAAVVCAALLTTLTGLVNGGRIYSRPIWPSSGREGPRH